MNGRVYDPILGRFLSADPNVDGVEDAQGYNRYSYVGNNPLGATDPTGYFSLKDVLPAIIAVVVTAVVVVATGPGGLAAINSWGGFFTAFKGGLTALSNQAIWGGAAGGFASGFSGSLLNGGSIGDAFKAGAIGGAIGAATAWAAGKIGGHFGADDGTFGQWAGRTAAHGAVGGIASELQGGEFRHGFYSSAASTGFMHSSMGRSLMGNAHIAFRTATAATIGGTASVLGGGKFANGAVTSAFQHLFNAEATRPKPKGVMFIRMNVENDPKNADQNAKSWANLIKGLRYDLMIDGVLKDGGWQLRFEMAFTENQALEKLAWAKKHNFEVFISSHGRRSNDDFAGMFGRPTYSRREFIAKVNEALGSNFLSDKTPWYSCNWTDGSRTPTQIFSETARSEIIWSLKRINDGN